MTLLTLREIPIRSYSRSLLAGLALSACSLLVAGCRVGPKYAVPTQPAPPPAFKENRPDAYKGVSPGTWKPAQPQDAVLKGKWWEVFNEPELNALEDQLDINNQNIAEYFQNFLASRTLVRQANAQLYPTVDLAPHVSTRQIAQCPARGRNRHRYGDSAGRLRNWHWYRNGYGYGNRNGYREWHNGSLNSIRQHVYRPGSAL